MCRIKQIKTTYTVGLFGLQIKVFHIQEANWRPQSVHIIGRPLGRFFAIQIRADREVEKFFENFFNKQKYFLAFQALEDEAYNFILLNAQQQQQHQQQQQQHQQRQHQQQENNFNNANINLSKVQQKAHNFTWEFRR